MQTLTYGSKRPEDGDKGSVFFDALADNVTQFDGHTHNGANSSRITSSGVTSTTLAILAAAWVDQGGGTHRQLVTMPGTLLYNDYFINAKLTASGHQLFPTIEKVSATTFYVYVNDNSLALTLYFTS